MLVLLALLFTTFGSGTTTALSPQQTAIFGKGIHAFDLETGCGRSAATYGSWDPLTLTYPSVPDEAVLIEAVKQFITRPGAYPNSPFVSNQQYITSIFTLSKLHDVNPLLILSIAKQENQFGSVGAAAIEKNNYFGITYTEDGRKVYRKFSSPEEGIEFFITKVGTNISDPEGFYVKRGLTNFYEYLTIHQMGFVAYPGEYPPEAPGASATPPYLFYDSLMDVYVDWDSEYAPTNYYKNSIAFINTVTGLSLSDQPSRPGECTPGQGYVSPDGYGWPVAPANQSKYGPTYGSLPMLGYEGCGHINPASGGDWARLPENKGKRIPEDVPIGCHSAYHMSGLSGALDLFYGGQNETAGAAVFAVVDGHVKDINHQSGTCFNLYLEGKDNFVYWYGHITNVGVYTNGHYEAKSPGDQFDVVAGQQIAIVDTWTPGHCNNTSGRDHLHIDRGCVWLESDGTRRYGDGGGSCRDPDFPALMESVYRSMPQ